jgi:molecular chaperone GrpE (heat shock protein)
MVERKLEKTMKRGGLEVVNPVGEAFDPQSMRRRHRAGTNR